MQAIMIKDEYPDIEIGATYEVERVYCEWYNHIKLKGNPRRYDADCFAIYHNGKRISREEAFNLFRINKVKKKLGMK